MLDIISKPFGYVLEWIYSFTGNYAISLLLFAVVVKLITFPLGIKQQKSMQSQARLRPKETAIRKKYAGRNDEVTKRKMNEELTKLYQDEKFNPLSGCLPLLIQFPIIIALYDVIRKPLTYLMHFTSETIDSLKNVLLTFDGYADVQAAAIDEISLLSKMKEAPAAFTQILSDVGKTIDDLPNLFVFGMNLGETPSFKPESSWLILLIPVLSLASAFLSMYLNTKFSYQSPQAKEQEGSMKFMRYAMPFFSFYIAFKVPAAVGLYWFYQNMLQPLQQFILSKMYKIPEITEEEMKAAEKLYAKAEKGQAKSERTYDGPKKRSLVYDDDDDDAPAVSPEPKKPQGKPVKGISAAPLKDDISGKAAKSDKKAAEEASGEKPADGAEGGIPAENGVGEEQEQSGDKGSENK